MNELGWVLLQSTVPVTCVAAVALVLERLASRRGPVAGAWVSAASLLVIVVLTPLAICGFPDRSSRKTPELIRRAAMGPDAVARQNPVYSSASTQALDNDEARGLLWSSRWWDRVVRWRGPGDELDSRADAAGPSRVGSFRGIGRSLVPAAIVGWRLGGARESAAEHVD